MKIVHAAGFELVIGFRSSGSSTPRALGGLVSSDHDGLADYFPMTAPSLFEGPPGAWPQPSIRRAVTIRRSLLEYFGLQVVSTRVGRGVCVRTRPEPSEGITNTSSTS